MGFRIGMATTTRPSASEARLAEPRPADVFVAFGITRDLAKVMTFRSLYRLELAIRLEGGALTVDTTITARDSAVPLSFGFHPYLAPPGAARGDWRVELPARTALELDDYGLPTGATTELEAVAFALGDRTYDDLFAVTPGCRFSVAASGRRATVELTAGYRYAQIYAPPDQPVICFEPMMAPVDALRSHQGLRSVPAGGRASATFALSVDHVPR